MDLRPSLFRKKYEKLQVAGMAGIAVVVAVFLAEIVLDKNDIHILRRISLVIPPCVALGASLVLYLVLVLFVKKKEGTKP